jgi:hypothetical protein
VAQAAGAAHASSGVPQLQSIQAVSFPCGVLTSLEGFTKLTSLSFRALEPGLRHTKQKEQCRALAAVTSLRCLDFTAETGNSLPDKSQFVQVLAAAGD